MSSWLLSRVSSPTCPASFSLRSWVARSVSELDRVASTRVSEAAISPRRLVVSRVSRALS